MIVNNSTNINKTNRHLSRQFIAGKKITTTYDVEIPGPSMGQEQRCGGVKLVNGIPT